MIALVLALAVTTPDFSAPPDTALLTFESGERVAVDWIQRRGRLLRTRSVLMRSGIREATFELGDSGTVTRSVTRVGDAGDSLSAPIERRFGAGSTAWSDQIPSTLEQVVQRARALGGDRATVAGGSLYRDAVIPVEVRRVDATDWTVEVNHKRYEVLTDAAGNLVSASLPEFGVTIERRTGFPPARNPLWPANAAPPDGAYRAEEVRVPAPQGHVLAGTLTLPGGAGPFPAAVLITGLSPHLRNNGTPPWMPLRDVADALTRRGIAVLRVDDRGVGASTGDRASSTTFDEADDVHTEVAWLRKRRGIDARRIVLVGYSEGGLIAPMVAAEDSALAGIVTLAAPGVSGPEVARYQTEAAVVRDPSIAPAAREAEIAKQLADSLSVREKSYLSIDPLAYARRVRCPALLLHGAADLTVPPRSAGRLAAAMRAAGNADVTVRFFPGVSHAFLPDPWGLPSGWVTLPGFATSPEVLRAIGEWAEERLEKRDLSSGPRSPRLTASGTRRPRSTPAR